MVLLAAPSHSGKLHSLTSRSIRRSPALHRSTALSSAKKSFGIMASQRKTHRSAYRSSLADRFLSPTHSRANSLSGREGSDTSSESREADLRRALETALGSLTALGGIYEQREVRWREEMRAVADDRERVEMLLRQVLGDEGGRPKKTDGDNGKQVNRQDD